MQFPIHNHKQRAVPRLARFTLWLPAHFGRLALPYFWAAMLVTVQWWFTCSKSNAGTFLEAVCLGSFWLLFVILFTGTCAAVPEPTQAMWRVWIAARWWFIRPHRWSPVQPMWCNLSLPQFLPLTDHQIWYYSSESCYAPRCVFYRFLNYFLITTCPNGCALGIYDCIMLLRPIFPSCLSSRLTLLKNFFFSRQTLVKPSQLCMGHRLP